MIPPAVIEEFLYDRPLRDFRKYKNLTEDQLEAMQRKLPIIPPIWKKLRIDQKAMFMAGVATEAFQYFADTGCGKTIVSIALIRYFWALQKINTALVLVPNEINKWEWRDEILKHSPTTSYVVLDGSSQEKWEQLERPPRPTIVIATYIGLIRMVAQRVPRMTKGEATAIKRLVKGDPTEPKLKKLLETLTDKEDRKLVTKVLAKRMREVPDRALLARLRKVIDAMFFDESTQVASKGTLPFRVFRQIAKSCHVIYGLTGTPFGRNYEMLWAQMFLIDGGETLGTTLGMFRAAFFTEKENWHTRFPEYVPDPSKFQILNRTLANCSIRYKAKEADLPRLVPIKKEVSISADALTYYTKAWDTVLTAGRSGNWREQQNSFVRARQISSGFIGVTDDEDGTKAQFEFEDNPKLDMLIAIIKSISPEAKILAMHDFVFSGTMISRALNAAKIKHVHLNKKSNQEAIKRQFNEDPETRVFVLNTAGAFGLNLQRANYGIFFERPVSPILQYQMERRYRRQYSEHETVFLYDCIARGTVDQNLLDYYTEMVKLQKGILDVDEDVELATPATRVKDNQSFLEFMGLKR